MTALYTFRRAFVAEDRQVSLALAFDSESFKTDNYTDADF